MQSLMPRGHLLLWKRLVEQLQKPIIVAGSFATAQHQQNEVGSSFPFNDIDFWTVQNPNGPLTEVILSQLVGEYNL